jgi:hypothetical protein
VNNLHFAENRMSISKTARIHDQSSDTYLERIRFKDSTGKPKSIELAPSSIQDHRLLKKHLLDAGATLPTNKTEAKTLLESVAAMKAPKHFSFSARPGWVRNGRAFAVGDHVVGQAQGIIGFRRSKPGDPRGHFLRKGDVESWKTKIGTPATNSSILMFSIATAFAAPLLKVANHSSFGFCLHSPSRSGKTLATLFAGSVVGLGAQSQLLNWNQTDARLQQQLPELNDCLTPIDDLKSMPGSDPVKHGRINHIAYVLASGSGTGRHSSFAQSREDQWRTIVLTSNEYSIKEIARRSRSERDPGETVRLVDLSAVFDDATTVFDRGRPTFTWDVLFRHCEENQGEVFGAFLAKLIDDSAKLAERVTGYVKTFTEAVHKEDDGNFALDIARKFGLVFAGGRLAMRYHLVPWSGQQFTDAIKKCYRASRELLPDPGVLVRSGRRTLLSFAKALPNRNDISGKTCSDLDGFWERTGNRVRCLIKRDKFNRMFDTDDQLRLVLDSLVASERVTLAETKNNKIKEQHIWPDGKRYRSIEIFWPYP